MRFLATIFMIVTFVSVIKAYEYRDYEQNKQGSRPYYDLSNGPGLFRQFAQDFGKNYKTAEESNQRYGNFVVNVKKINEMNAQGGDAEFEINMFADKGDNEKEEEFH